MNLEEIVAAEAVVVRPGDILVVAFNRTLSMNEVEMVKDRIATMFPEIKLAVIDQAHLGLIRKEENES